MGNLIDMEAMENLINNQKELINYMPVSIFMLVLTVIFLWKIFEKTGEAGWKTIIPVYNIYIIFNKFFQIYVFIFYTCN